MARAQMALQPAHPGVRVAQVLRDCTHPTIKACCWQRICIMLKHVSCWLGYLQETLICLKSFFGCKSSFQADCSSPFFMGRGGVRWFPSSLQFLVPLSHSLQLVGTASSLADSASGRAVLCARPVRCFDLGVICLGFFKEHSALLEVLFLNSVCERVPRLPVVR